MKHPLSTALQHIRRVLGAPTESAESDRALLERFTQEHDEPAFRALVQRHGPMVLGVCRRLLDHPQDAEDAFQATFLVLVRRARAIPWQDSVGHWLHRVAYRVSLKARANRAYRRATEKQCEVMVSDGRPEASSEAAQRDLQRVLDEELQRLPARYRAPLVLCYLQGKTHEQAAEELGWNRGSMAYRVERALDLLRARLTGRGVAMSTALAGTSLAESAASAPVPALLLGDTVQAATLVAAGEAAAVGGISAQVTALTEGVLKTMGYSKLRTVAIVLLVLGVVGGGLGLLWRPSQAANVPGDFGPRTAPADTPQVKTDRGAVVKGNTQFALDLYARLRDQQGNLFLSPYSISTALAMTSAGARGQTLEEMNKALHFSVAQERLHPAFASLLWELNAGGKPKGYQLRLANALWGQKNYPFRNEFLTTTQANYGAGLNEVDFAGATEQARQTINAWVEKQTEDKIKELLKPGVLDGTRLVLTNAIYFKGEWNVQFKKEDTKEEPFLGTAEKMNVPLMYQRGNFKYLKGDGFRALELTYVGKDLAMVVLLPEKVDGLAEFEKSLTEAKLTQWLGQIRPVEKLPVWLPKFKMTSDFSLKNELSALGMPTAFSSGGDFSGLNGGKEDLHISAVVHKAFVEVNEEGTEAAAATAVLVGKTGAAVDPPRFRADHPFVFLIRDYRSGSILFLGRLVNPKS